MTVIGDLHQAPAGNHPTSMVELSHAVTWTLRCWAWSQPGIEQAASRGGSRGWPGPPPIFGKVNFIFFTLYTMSEKIFLKLNLDFIVAEIRGVFGIVGGVCMCVNRNRGRYCFFFVHQRPNFEWYPRPCWSQKYMPDWRKSHLIFKNFLGEAPRPPRQRLRLRRSVQDFTLLPGPLLKIPGSVLGQCNSLSTCLAEIMQTLSSGSAYSLSRHP